MRNQARAVVLAVLSFVAVIALAVASAFMSAVALGATALIVPGTGTPDPDNVANYREHAWDRYIDGVVCTDPVSCADPVLDGIPYPASFWPLSFIPNWCVPGKCEKWDVSVGEGIANLKTALEPFLVPESDEDVFIFGYSQGGAVVSNALQYLGDLDLPDAVKARLKVVTIGGIENPDGGLWQRLAWLRYLFGTPIPLLDITFEPPMPVDTGIHTTSIGFEYDPVVLAPRFWGNPFAMLNAFAAFDTVHGYYLAPDGDDDPTATLPYGYTPETLAPQLDCSLNKKNCRTDSFGNVYITIPALSLPLTNLVRSWADSAGLGWLAKPFIDLVDPVLREAVDLGYDWSGDPGVPRGMSILPFKLFQNWIKVGVDFAVAAIKGVEAFIGNFINPPVTGQLEPSERSERPEVVVEYEDAAPTQERRRDATPEGELSVVPEVEPTDDAPEPNTDVENEDVQLELIEDGAADEAESDSGAEAEDDTPAVSERDSGTSSDAPARTKRTRAAA